MKKYLLIISFLFISFFVLSQSKLKVMQYNLMYYDKDIYDCDETSNNVDTKNDNLKIILSKIKPDIFCVNELNADNSSINILQNKVLNIDGVDYWKHADLTDNFTTSMIYYDSRKVNLESQAYIDFDDTYLRQIQIYNMNLVDDNSIKFTFFVTHLKAGEDKESERADITQSLMNYIDSKGAGNYFFMGDFNFYNSDEDGYQNVIKPSNSAIAFVDPIDQAGDWNNNSSFTNIHTQSTHKDDDGCFSYGGMDDRFDFILISKNIKNKTADIEYVADSYTTIGQDGNHFNKSINEGVNSSVSSEMADALFNMSDHLPLSLEIQFDVDITADISTTNNSYQISCTPNPFAETLNIRYKATSPTDIKIFNITGRLVYFKHINSVKEVDINWNTTKLKKGLYFIQIQNNKSIKTIKTIKI